MIIPIRCFTCGKVLADKWNYYCKEVEKKQDQDSVLNVNSKTMQKTFFKIKRSIFKKKK